MNFLEYLKKAADWQSDDKDCDLSIRCPLNVMTDKAKLKMLHMADDYECKWCDKAQKIIGYEGPSCPTVAEVHLILKKVAEGKNEKG